MPANVKLPLLHYHDGWWKVENECIWYLANIAPSDPSLPVAKWYFTDETQDFNGPYDSRLEAESALASYCKTI